MFVPAENPVSDPVSDFKTRLAFYSTEPSPSAYVAFYWAYSPSQGHYRRECTGPINQVGVHILLKADAQQTIRIESIKHW